MEFSVSNSTSSDTPTSLSYRDAGVDIDTGNQLIEQIKPIVKDTFRPGVLTGLGGFGALFELPLDKYKHPVLVSGTDGVGTKLKLALALNKHDTIGIDLVAMCVNDIIVTGAEPLFFLDYYASGKLELDVATSVIKGIAEGCKQSGAALTGGETAEMPGVYSDGDYDLAGFSVGIVEKSKIIQGDKVSPGDTLIGLASSGPHSNGYSLIRKVLELSQADLSSPMGDATLGDALIAPTRIYVKSLLSLFENTDVHALAHITGGGLLENIPRVLPKNSKAVIDQSSWELPTIFQWIQQQGNISNTEMLRTFNCGVGMVIALPKDQANQAIEQLTATGETSWIIGHIEQTEEPTPFVEMM